MGFLYVGLDGEMTSSEVQNGGKLIQIGLTVRDLRGELVTFTSGIRPDDMENWDWQEQAAEVHKITREEIETFPSAAEVDMQAFAWLRVNGAVPNRRMNTIAVGFNIMAFDMPFLKEQLPKTYSLFSRRGGDLNAMCFMLDGKDGVNYDKWKARAKDYAEVTLGNNYAHNAGWDSQMHMLCFEYLKGAVK